MSSFPKSAQPNGRPSPKTPCANRRSDSTGEGTREQRQLTTRPRRALPSDWTSPNKPVRSGQRELAGLAISEQAAAAGQWHILWTEVTQPAAPCVASAYLDSGSWQQADALLPHHPLQGRFQNAVDGPVIYRSACWPLASHIEDFSGADLRCTPASCVIDRPDESAAGPRFTSELPTSGRVNRSAKRLQNPNAAFAQASDSSSPGQPGPYPDHCSARSLSVNS